MFVKLPTHRKTTLLSQKKNITELLHSKLQATKYKEGYAFLSQSWLSKFSEDLMIRCYENGKIPDIRAFIKIVSGHKF